jgi:hypothetical protein
MPLDTFRSNNVNGLGSVYSSNCRPDKNAAGIERASFMLESSTAAHRITSLETRGVAMREQIEQLAGKLADAENVAESAGQIDASARNRCK